MTEIIERKSHYKWRKMAQKRKLNWLKPGRLKITWSPWSESSLLWLLLLLLLLSAFEWWLVDGSRKLSCCAEADDDPGVNASSLSSFWSLCFCCWRLWSVRRRLLRGPVMPEVDGADSADAATGPEPDRLAGIPVNARPILKGGWSSPELETCLGSWDGKEDFKFLGHCWLNFQIRIVYRLYV